MAIAIKEQLRATASGENRMDFLASQISSYRLLVAARVRRGDPLGAFGASEMIKARWLAEQLGAGEAVATDDIHPAQAGLGPGVLVLSFANVDTEQPVLISASRTTVRARELGDSQEELAPATSSAGDAPARSEQPPARGFLIVRTAPPAAGMAEAIAAYRRLLGIPAPTPEERAGRRDFAKALYDFLIGPIEEELRDKDELLILPEGSLCSLPFETLVMPDGRYLVERFHVTYAPSLAVRRLLARQTTSAVGARPLLALGGALYGGAGGPARDAPQISDQQLASLRVDAARLLDTKRSTRELYATLGLDSWNDLPGTLAEVNSIGALMPRGTVLTGADASELRVKQMSRSGELARFGVIHFATHGLAVPEAPELSALVLSLGRSEGDEDGFLTTREITELRLNADFVNLSACQTGMGKILAGEGIVGLSHAFLSAGARGLSVSLWPVSDDATRQFMVDLYQGVQERGLSFARAMTEVKRAFIRAGQWREPYYWAPFVYYGN
jgi:CHAT domain-containing protein